MAQTPVEMTKDLTLTLIKTGRLSADVLQDTLQQAYATLSALKTQEESETSAPVPTPEPAAVDWRKSIARRTITCLECGLICKQLSRRHLMTHGLDGRSYRAKYGIPLTQPLAARATTERRRQVAQKSRPWEKAPMYRKGHARNGYPSPEPEAEAVYDEAEELGAEAPAQPKQQRKTTRKKQTARKKSPQG
jgi:predicted transcriptional regulator